MCAECRQNPCHPSCPCAPEPEPVFVCDNCEEGIYEGDEVYEIGGCKYCADCIYDSKYIASQPEPYEPDPMDIWKAEIERKMCEDAEY